MLISQLAAAFFGTWAFAVLFCVPGKLYGYCGLVGCIGWAFYYVLTGKGMLMEGAVFLATMAVVISAHYFAYHCKCPATVFIITGIFPLVPGGGIYWTAYYLVTGHTNLAFMNGFSAVRCAFMIVLGIVSALEIPRFMQMGIKKKS